MGLAPRWIALTAGKTLGVHPALIVRIINGHISRAILLLVLGKHAGLAQKPTTDPNRNVAVCWDIYRCPMQSNGRLPL
jgi:hypothetical protein